MRTIILMRAIKIWLFLTAIAAPGRAADKIQVVTTLPDLKAITEAVGGEYVDVFAIVKGYQDPHFVDAKPSYIVKLQKAEVFAQIGLDLEVGWVPPLLEGARNAKILPGGSGYVDASKGVALLEIPQGDPATLRAGGDIHVNGNPHYWLDPRNGKIIAQNIHAVLVNVRPDLEKIFSTNLAAFEKQIDEHYAQWTTKLAPYKGSQIIAYHNSWPYFAKSFNLEIVDFIEPKPGVPPSPGHLVKLIQKIKTNQIKAILVDPYFDTKPAKSVAEKSGATVIPIASSVSAYDSIKNYFDLFDYNVNQLVAVLSK